MKAKMGQDKFIVPLISGQPFEPANRENILQLAPLVGPLPAPYRPYLAAFMVLLLLSMRPLLLGRQSLRH